MATKPINGKAHFKAVIFDMDGTVIESPLDFDRIRAECGVPPEAPWSVTPGGTVNEPLIR